MKKLLLTLIAAAALALPFSGLQVNTAHAYTNSRLMDDAVFDNVGTMNEAQIQSFLASKGPCLANYNDVDPNWNGSSWSYTGSVPASHIIFKAAQMWGLNPQVILATLQKEESLITGTACDAWRYNSAMGYACPDSGGCNAKYAGFTRQVLWGSWQLKFNKERSIGNINWDGDGDLAYVGYMTQGNFSRGPGQPVIFYDGNATIDGQLIHLDNGTTASLYSYTPHLGQSFPGIFESWFGSTYAAGVPNTSCQSQQNVYRFWSKRFNNAHFFTSSDVEKNALMGDANWQYEGVAFCGLLSPQTGYVPVYRFWSPSFNNVHFYTSSDAEKNAVMNDPHWRYEGIAFYDPIDPSVDATAVAIKRYWSPVFNNDHFYTGGVVEQNALGGDRNWRYESIGWYAQMPQ